jgi:hypothetical protein
MSFRKKIIIGFLVIFVAVMAHNISRYSPTRSTTSSPAELTPIKEVEKNLTFDFSWTKGGFDQVMILSGSIKNGSEFDIKDLLVSCKIEGKSGTQIGVRQKTVYEVVRAGKQIKIKDINMGLIPDQASNASCEIFDFTIIEQPKK